MDAVLMKLQHYCAYQERCHQEVKEKCLSFQVYGEQADAYIAQLISDNYLNEQRFAAAYAGGKFRVSQWGRIKIKMALQQKQVSSYCIEKGLASIDTQDYEDTLRSLASKKWGQTSGQSYQRKFKCMQYLRQKGFEPALIAPIVDELSKNDR
jgi:regulatory protein